MNARWIVLKFAYKELTEFTQNQPSLWSKIVLHKRKWFIAFSHFWTIFVAEEWWLGVPVWNSPVQWNPLSPLQIACAHRLGLWQQTSWYLLASFSLFSGPKCTVGSYCTGRCAVPIVPIEDCAQAWAGFQLKGGGDLTQSLEGLAHCGATRRLSRYAKRRPCHCFRCSKRDILVGGM